MEFLKDLIRDVPDFPSPGILFRDIAPLLRDPGAFAAVVEHLAERYMGKGVELVAGIESRGFLLGAPLAVALGAGFVPVRKPGKLPGLTVRREYTLEYGASHLEIHSDAVEPGQRIVLVDDVLATGGTARAALHLLEELGAEVLETAFLLELGGLDGRSALRGRAVHSLLVY